MKLRAEEEPEPDQDPDEEPASAPAAAGSGLVPSVEGGGGRDFEYRTELLTQAQLTDGKSLSELLTKASTEEWDLVDVLGAGDRHVILLRRRKKPQRESRPVGFRLQH